MGEVLHCKCLGRVRGSEPRGLSIPLGWPPIRVGVRVRVSVRVRVRVMDSLEIRPLNRRKEWTHEPARIRVRDRVRVKVIG